MTADEMREMQWVKPELMAQIRFVEWTAEGRLRHAAFLGLRFAGKVRAGLVPHPRREVFKALQPLTVPSSTCRTRRHPAGAAA